MDVKGKLLDTEGKPVTPEKAREIIEKAKAAKPVEITGEEVPASTDLKEYRKNALNHGLTLRGEYTNRDTGRKTKLTRGVKNGGLKEVLRHDIQTVGHIQSVAAIPRIIENGVYLGSIKNEDLDVNPEVASYDYYIAGLRIGTKDFTVKAVVATDTQGNRYYDHKLTETEKGKLLDPAFWVTSPGRGQGGLELDKIKDKRLTAILSSLFQTESPPDTPLSPDFPETSSPENDSGLLFQLTRAEEVEEARESVRRGRSREEFINDRLESGAEAGDDAPGGAEDEAEAREWLGSVYDEAKGLAERRLLGIKERQAGRNCLKTVRTVRVKLRIAACSPAPTYIL
jgi:hypothetical protein